MASITPTITKLEAGSQLVEWDQINADDQGAAIRVSPGLVDRTVVATGTFNGGAYSIEISHDNVAFAPALDAGGTAISFAAAGAAVIGTVGLWIKVVNDTNGTTEDVNVHILCVE